MTQRTWNIDYGPLRGLYRDQENAWIFGVCAGIAILLFFQRFATFTVQAINAVLVRNAASAANIGQLRDTANDLRLLFASTLLGYIFWRARHVLSGGSKRPTACTDTCRPTLPQP